MIKWIRSLGLIYQIGAIVLIGFGISSYLSINLLSSESSKSLSLLSSNAAVQRVLSVVDILGQTPESLDRSIVEASSSSDLSLSITSNPQIVETNVNSDDTRLLEEKFRDKGIKQVNLSLVKRTRPIMNMSDMHNAMMSGRTMTMPRDLHIGYLATIEGSIELKNGKWLNFSSGIQEDITNWSVSAIVALAVVMFVTLTLSIFIIHRALRPVQTLGKAATEFALKRKVTLVSDKGPKDLLPTIKSFNKMQVDISEFIDERTRLLAAISHDLRTPLTSLRLRLEFAEDTEDKQQMLKSISIMEQMLKATMSFAKDGSNLEERQPINIDSLLQTIVDEFDDRAVKVHYTSPGHLVEPMPPITIRRMVENLINNAYQYGGEGCEIRLSVTKRPECIEFTVSDTGIGIDPSKFEEVLKPFSRLDKARDTDSSNVGLGLATTQALANNYGGKLSLSSNTPHGLICTFTISVVQ
ncbi:HAMP domain-containing sensor histidine kinase [Vibrio sp. EA2]|uniref:HAMP domain-containing sensor histidine kinase n=1 Tax=Vibrio sp. EA2 TaxID=3079860 RepID=UPI0029490ECC|nr:HAMP domain-containing sensor histidine kinase [Vibrio sp. EA2]MDV6251768.1 HAMP domain-containing sensor histidine kinase [Vibrio sp. EA2]